MTETTEELNQYENNIISYRNFSKGRIENIITVIIPHA